MKSTPLWLTDAVEMPNTENKQQKQPTFAFREKQKKKQNIINKNKSKKRCSNSTTHCNIEAFSRLIAQSCVAEQ
jgi:hypothetical protein